MQSKLKVLISYHKPYKLLKDSTFVPIHVGRDLADAKTKDGKSNIVSKKWLLKNLIGDNTSDNISAKNREYCELTAQYWAWKNYDKLNNPDYIGFMHYRRHFEFFTPYEKFLNSNEKNRKNIIDTLLSNADVIAPELFFCNGYTNYTHYFMSENFSYQKDLDVVLDIVKNLYPDYSNALETYMKSSYAYFLNMFIMKKEMFFDYSNWLFSILEELEKQIDMSDYDIEERRVIGRIAEILFGIYITKHKDNIKIKHLPLVYIPDSFSFDIVKIKQLIRKLKPFLF